jgi:4-hydroxy-3-methylbut-2-enyl diphosphate reductase
MIDCADDLRGEWVRERRRVGVTAGASAPEVLVRDVIERLRAFGAEQIEELHGVVEKIVFPLPRGLHGTGAAKAPEVGPRS